MKKHWVFLIFFLILFVLYFEVDLIYSFFFRDSFSYPTPIYYQEYQNIQEKLDSLQQEVSLWEMHPESHVSKVVLHDPYLFLEQITILKGKEEGISLGDIVYDWNGYIGKVIHVKNHSSVVELVTSANTLLQVQIQNSFGILQNEKGEMIIKNITSKEKIEVGSIVYTSAYSVIQKNIPVAIVEEVIDQDVEQILKVKPFLQIDQLNYCIVERTFVDD